MARITVNGISVKYELDGPPDAPVVTLSHSLATDLGMWEPQMAALLPRFRVLRYNTRGHGGTDAPPAPYSLDELAEDAHALLTALGVERTHFVGLSMGGMVGQTLALAHPEMLRSLVLSDTRGAMPRETWPLWDERVETARTAGMQAHVEPTLARWFTRGFIEAHPPVIDAVREMIRATPVEGYAGCIRAIREFDLLERLPAITASTLILLGDEDQGAPPQAARAIQERIPGAELVVIESASHLSNIEQPEQFNRALLAFLEKVSQVDE
jgi:3-oxoadipate enol-lactonase